MLNSPITRQSPAGGRHPVGCMLTSIMKINAMPVRLTVALRP